MNIIKYSVHFSTKTFLKVFSTFVLFIFSVSTSYSQYVSRLITPDSELNKKLVDIDITETKLIRFETFDDGLTLDPHLPSEWTYIVGINLQTKFGRVDFAFFNGMIYSNSTNIKYVNFRKRIYPQLFTDKIKTNAFAIGFRKEDQAAIIVVTEEPKRVFIEVEESVMGRRLYYEFYMNKNECKLIRIVNKFPPYLP